MQAGRAGHRGDNGLYWLGGVGCQPLDVETLKQSSICGREAPSLGSSCSCLQLAGCRADKRRVDADVLPHRVLYGQGTWPGTQHLGFLQGADTVTGMLHVGPLHALSSSRPTISKQRVFPLTLEHTTAENSQTVFVCPASKPRRLCRHQLVVREPPVPLFRRLSRRLWVPQAQHARAAPAFQVTSIRFHGPATGSSGWICCRRLSERFSIYRKCSHGCPCSISLASGRALQSYFY